MTTTYQRAIELSERPDKIQEINAFVRYVLGYPFGSKDFQRVTTAFRRGRNAVEKELEPILKDEDE